MKTTTQANDKRSYSPPIIEQIMLDHEISLAMESDPPIFESKCNLNTPEYFNNDPLKMDLT